MLQAGESSAAALSGLPKITSRSISGGGLAALSPCAAAMDAVRKTHAKLNESFIYGSSFLWALGTRVENPIEGQRHSPPTWSEVKPGFETLHNLSTDAPGFSTPYEPL